MGAEIKYSDVVSFWKAKDVASENKLELALDNFRILFAYHSGKIENDKITYHDTREIFSDGKVSGYSGDTRAIFELQNQKLCYEFLINKIVAKEKITISLVKEIQGILCAGTYDYRRYIENGERPGAFKKHDYIVGISEVGYNAEDVEVAISELIDEVYSAPQKDIVKIGAYFHDKFEFIHPFADGNGRTGRTLLNYYFLTNDHPPVVIHNENKATYDLALHAYDEFENIDAMAVFLQEELVSTWAKSIQRKKE